jgi:probable HAF family extracellular repeat protein
MQPLPTLPGTTGQSDALAINNAGTIVGYALVNNRRRPMVIVNGVASDLGTLGGQEGLAIAINEAGDIAGESQPLGSTDFHPTLWPHTGGIVDLQTLTGGFGLVNAISSTRQVVGDLAGRGFLWTEATGMTLLALAQGDSQSLARGINTAGLIVGGAILADQVPGMLPPLMRARLWEQGTSFDLGELVDTPGWVLFVAQAINDAGHILVRCDPEDAAPGLTGPQHTCLLTPVSFPTPPPVDRPTKPRRPGTEKKDTHPHEERGR